MCMPGRPTLTSIPGRFGDRAVLGLVDGELVVQALNNARQERGILLELRPSLVNERRACERARVRRGSSHTSLLLHAPID